MDESNDIADQQLLEDYSENDLEQIEENEGEDNPEGQYTDTGSNQG